MARFAHVRAKVPCPRCGAELVEGGAIGFQWGYCSNPRCGAYFSYEVGEPLVWRQARRGDVPAWSYFRGEDANIGDPSFSDLIVRESEFEIRSCHACNLRIDGIAVLIARGAPDRERRRPRIRGSLPECDVGDPRGGRDGPADAGVG